MPEGRSLRCIVAGTRTATREQTMAAITACPFRSEVAEVLSGCASGADTHGEHLAAQGGLPVRRFPANWAKHGKAAGMIRNRQMAENADALIAVWDGQSRGTKNMIAEAKARGLRVFVWRTDRGAADGGSDG